MAMHIDNNIRSEYKKKSGENSFSSFTYLVMTRHVIIHRTENFLTHRVD